MNKDLISIVLLVTIINIIIYLMKYLIYHRRYNRSINKSIYRRSPELSDLDIEILEIYESSGIKIPYDIIEELEYRSFDNREDINKFIETQRNSWKLENNKKPFK